MLVAFKRSNYKQNLTLMIISYEIYQYRPKACLISFIGNDHLCNIHYIYFKELFKAFQYLNIFYNIRINSNTENGVIRFVFDDKQPYQLTPPLFLFVALIPLDLCYMQSA